MVDFVHSRSVKRNEFLARVDEQDVDKAGMLLLQKGVFPYEYMSDFKKYEETCLPSKEDFYSDLTGCGITDDEYTHAQKVWDTFKIKNLMEYNNLYLLTDVLLLTDVFEKFRNMSMTDYGLDPANGYISLPNFAWDAMLKKTGVELDLIRDQEIYEKFEQGLRGGICMISQRMAQANNKYMRDYDKTKESSYIQYVDANNLYGLAMMDKIPYSFLSSWTILTTRQMTVMASFLRLT